ncbi:hypothetical protein [Nocardioides rubriscoriae]|uniref:hypothetical protein n=1 Tax=Nocardioides rubriscoriae TaxID=642762 RepID=UPI0011DF4A98|nr:hypothetical protein [Nocardioides rubriscoriae]
MTSSDASPAARDESGPPAPVKDAGEDRLSIYAAILLGIAATLTAFSAYNAALTDGDALKGYTESNSQLSDSNYFYGRGDAKQSQDYQLWLSYNVAYLENQNGTGAPETKDAIYEAMDDNLRQAVDWWATTETSETPFDDDSPYINDDYGEGESTGEASQAAFLAGQAADNQGDDYELASVLLALCLFFAGIATLFRKRGVVVSLLVVATLVLAAGAVQLAVGAGA